MLSLYDLDQTIGIARKNFMEKYLASITHKSPTTKAFYALRWQGIDSMLYAVMNTKSALYALLYSSTIRHNVLGRRLSINW